MEKKQSSVELFAIALYEKGFLKGNGDEINDLLEEHKAMHKEEICDAYCKAGLEIAHNDSIKESGLAQLYFNETFGGNNEH